MTHVAVYEVQGMSCGHCRDAVTRELTRLPGVTTVEVDLDSGQVSVTSDEELPLDDVRAAVDEAGYDLR